MEDKSSKKMSTGGIIGIVILSLLLLLGFWGVSSYNNMVALRENVNAQMSNIDVQLQRRSDLIPNIVNTVKGYASHESEVLNSVTQSREKLAGASTLSEKATADAELSSSLNRLLMVVENYPNLKADTQFTALTDNLEGTENRISTARKDYNTAVQNYNRSIKSFPTVILASMFGFSESERFEATEKASEVPTVSFE